MIDHTYLTEDPALSDTTDNPASTRFDDCYFDQDGLAESRYVFLEGNALTTRFPATAPATRFVIGETGFGTGLNALACAQLFLEMAPPSSRLHFCSVERYPLKPETLRDSHRHWPALAALSEELLQVYPPRIRGWHRCTLGQGRIILDLCFDDIGNWLTEMPDTNHALVSDVGRYVDAWFLDGFAPAKNPAMWTQDVLNGIGRLSKPGATFATFTAAGTVRRGLETAGFKVHKQQGFGRKRHMLTGRRQSTPAPASPKEDAVPWHCPPPKKTGDVLVIGSGLAGAHAAASLARRGRRVQVLEAGKTAAPGASNNPHAILYTRLSPDPGDLNRMHLAAYLLARRFYQQQGYFRRFGNACGVLQLLSGDKAHNSFQRLHSLLNKQDWVQFLTVDAVHALCPPSSGQAGLLFPDSGWLDAGAVCRDLLDHPLIDVTTDTPVEAVHPGSPCKVQTSRNTYRASAVVIACGTATNTLLPDPLPLKTIRGQSSRVENLAGALPAMVVCGDRYIVPRPDQQALHIGASFELDDSDTSPRADSDAANLSAARCLLPGLIHPDAGVAADHVGLRCASPDYLPQVGAVPDTPRWLQNYEALARDAKQSLPIPGQYLPGVYVSTGHGSRGLATCLLAGELLASTLCGEPRPLPAQLGRALAPGRFLLRDIKRGKV